MNPRIDRSRWIIGAAALAFGACAYRPGALLEVPTGTPTLARQVGCLDVAVSIAGDRAVPDADPVVTIAFGNRCERRVDVDLATVRVVAEYEAGVAVLLTEYDPKHEIERLPLDARRHGSEAIEFQAPTAQSALPRRVCVDVRAITPSEGARDVAPLCFANDGDRLVPAIGGPS